MTTPDNTTSRLGLCEDAQPLVVNGVVVDCLGSLSTGRYVSQTDRCAELKTCPITQSRRPGVGQGHHEPEHTTHCDTCPSNKDI